MPRKKKEPAKPTSGEMEILQMLWTHGGLGLSEAQKLLGRPIGYTTIQTRLNRMVEKGLVTRSAGRPAVYEAAVQPDEVSARFLDLLLERVSGGEVVPLVAHLMKERPLSRSDITELKRLIAAAERRFKKTSAGEEQS